MAKTRRFERVTFIRPKRRETENPIPPYSKALRLELAQNAEAVGRVTCLDFVLTMGLPAAALASLQPSVERFFRGDLSPRIDEISAEDAKVLFGDGWGQISREISELVAKTPESRAHWFLSVGSDVSGCTAFKVWPIIMSEPSTPFCPPRDVLYDQIELMILERFAVILNMNGLPEPWVKL